MQFDNYIEAFSNYIETGDAQSLAPYLSENSNPEYLKIYRNGAAKACLDALAANFPTLMSYLGVDQFKTLAREYIAQHWPTDSRLSTYGDEFANHIATVADQCPAYSYDIARLDRAWLNALFSCNEKPLLANDITEMFSQESQQDLFLLELASSVNLVHLDKDCMTDWLALKFSSDSNQGKSGMQSILLWRHEHAVQYRALSAFEDSFVTSIVASESILVAAERAVTENPSEDLGALFAGLLSAGILIKKQSLN